MTRPEMVLPHTWRPFGVRMAGAIFGGAVLLVALVAWFAFPPEVRDKFTPFQRGTIVFFVLLAYALGYGLMRSRVVADDGRLVVVNGFRRRDFAWAEVIAIRLPPGAPWATLDLADGTTCAVMAIQGSDGPRATTAVRELRALIDG